ncbi:hypothetical protein G7Y89_g10416 [Cudoniella acicularis]|uniref:Uncharacterized protein n=1 Tax=Cudoniella acicularis TaxID=354080 RepID=A0A8H4RCT4_9HELO|nr:hypothetical protein G7Y89_g10416 [Cudoniella acicularis]
MDKKRYPSGTKRVVLEDLAPELIELIFEELYSIELESAFSGLRLLSRKLEAIIAPFRYRKIVLNHEIFEDQFAPYLSGIRSNICANTRHLVIKSETLQQKWGHVVELLLNCERLQDLTHNTPMPLLLKETILGRPALRFHLGYLISASYDDDGTEYASKFPISSIVSMKAMGIPYTEIPHYDNPLKTLLHESKNLESLSLCQVHSYVLQDPRWKFPFLRLKSLSIDQGWISFVKRRPAIYMDCSRLEDLELNVDLFPCFLQDLRTSKFPHLRSLRTVGEESHNSQIVFDRFKDFPERALPGLSNLFNGQHLEVVDIACVTSKFPIDCITNNKSLQILKLRDYDCLRKKIWLTPPGVFDFPGFSAEQIAMLQQNCPLISELDICIDVQIYHGGHLLDIVNKFRYLSSLRLSTNVVYDYVDGTGEEFAKNAVALLQSKQRTIPLSNVKIVLLMDMLKRGTPKPKQVTRLLKGQIWVLGEDCMYPEKYETPRPLPKTCIQEREFIFDINSPKDISMSKKRYY